MRSTTESSKSTANSSKQLLLDAGRKLFAQLGFDGTSVKALADEAGVNVSLVSYHFGGKEGLYRACVEQFGQTRLLISQRILVPTSTAEELKVRLEMWIDELLTCFAEEPELFNIIQRECDKDFPIIEDVFEKTLFKVFETLVAFIVAAQKKGILRKEFDPQVTATLFFGGLAHFARIDRQSHKRFNRTIKTPAYRQKIREHLVGIIMSGMLREK